MHVETVVKLSLKKDIHKIEVAMQPDGAQVKLMCGLDMGENYNKTKKENPDVKQCPQEKIEYIKEALRIIVKEILGTYWTSPCQS